MKRFVLFALVAGLALAVFSSAPQLVPARASSGPGAWSLPNASLGAPSRPTYVGDVPALSGFDFLIHQREQDQWHTLTNGFLSQHGADCSAPPATHPLTTPDGSSGDGGAAFVCNNHLMMSIADTRAGFSTVVMTPPAMLDFSQGEAVFSFNLATDRARGEDWAGIWLTPYADNLTFPRNQDNPDGAGMPQHAVALTMAPVDGTNWAGELFSPGGRFCCIQQSNDTLEQALVATSAKARAHFELHVSRTHIRFGLSPQAFQPTGVQLKPQYAATGLFWVDSDVPALSFTQAVLQLQAVSYDACRPTCPAITTWHWSDLAMSSADPFTIIRGDHRIIDNGQTTRVAFAAAAPANSFLRFGGYGNNSPQLSFDGGATWTAARRQPFSDPHTDYANYFTPVPAGLASVLVKPDGSTRMLEDFSIFSSSAVALPPNNPPPPPTNPPPPPTNPPPPGGGVAEVPGSESGQGTEEHPAGQSGPEAEGAGGADEGRDSVLLAASSSLAAVEDRLATTGGAGQLSAAVSRAVGMGAADLMSARLSHRPGRALAVGLAIGLLLLAGGAVVLWWGVQRRLPIRVRS